MKNVDPRPLRQVLKGRLVDVMANRDFEPNLVWTRDELFERTGAEDDATITHDYFDGCLAQLVDWKLVELTESGFRLRKGA